MSIRVFVKNFMEDDSGQATLEYVLLLSVVATAAVGMSRTLLSALDRSIQIFGATLEKDLRTGRMNVSNWSN